LKISIHATEKSISALCPDQRLDGTLFDRFKNGRPLLWTNPIRKLDDGLHPARHKLPSVA